MDMHRLPASIRRVTVLAIDESGAMVPRTIYRKGGKKRKGSEALRPVERAVRRVAQATDAMTSSYVSRHDQSNAKKRDGWLRDFNWNVVKATKTGVKKLKINSPLIP
jgi:hypothetical protein